jgi:hypothetical protein
MSIISALRTYILTNTTLSTGAPLWVDYLGKEPDQYAIIPVPGARITERNIDDSTVRDYPFAFQAVVSTAADAERLASNAFFEDFGDWLESQTEAGTLPTLATGKKAIEIQAVSWGFLLEQGDSGTGVYQIQCRLTYEQAAGA